MRKGDFDDETRLRSMDPKWLKKYHILDKINNGNSNGFIDIDAGINIADKVCSKVTIFRLLSETGYLGLHLCSISV